MKALIRCWGKKKNVCVHRTKLEYLTCSYNINKSRGLQDEWSEILFSKWFNDISLNKKKVYQGEGRSLRTLIGAQHEDWSYRHEKSLP